MVVIYSRKTLFKLYGFLVLLVIVLTVSIVIIHFQDIKYWSVTLDAITPFLVIFLAMFIPYSVYYLFFGWGRRIEITEEGINLGKRYIGPVSSIEEIDHYGRTKIQQRNLLIPWSEIRQVSYAMKEPGETLFVKNKEAYILYFFIIHTNKSDIYSVEVTGLQMDRTKKVITDFKYEYLIQEDLHIFKRT